MEFERFLSASGPTEGHIDRPSDRKIQGLIQELEKKVKKSQKALDRFEKNHGIKSDEFYSAYKAGSLNPGEDLEKDQDKWAKKYDAHIENAIPLEDLKEKAQQSQEERLTEKEETWRDNLKEYVGKITPEQEKIIKEDLAKTLFSSKARFARSIIQMKDFLAIYEELPLEKEASPKLQLEIRTKRQEKLKAYFNDWAKLDPYKNWRKENSKFVSKLLNSMDEEQRVKFRDEMKNWRDKVKEMQKD